MPNNLMNKLFVFSIILLTSFAAYLSAGIFKPGFFLWADLGFPLVPLQSLNQNLYAWEYLSNFPLKLSVHSTYYFLIYILNVIGIPLWVISKIFCILPVFIRGGATYFLMSQIIVGKDRIKMISCLIPAVFFMVIPLDIYSSPIPNISIAFLPLALGLFIKGWNSDKKIGYALLISLVFIFISFHFIIFGLAFSYIVFYAFFVSLQKSNSERIAILKFLVQVVSAIFLIHAYYLLPLIVNYFKGDLQGSGWSNLSNTVSPYLTWLEQSVHNQKLVYIIRLVQGHSGSFYYYCHPVVILSGFILVIFAFFCVYAKNKIRFYFCATAIISVILASGISYPFSKYVYMLLFKASPFFHNPPYFIFSIAFSYACMIGITLEYLLRNDGFSIFTLRITKKHILLVLIPIVFIVTGSVFIGNSFRGKNVVIPQDYFLMRKLLIEKSSDGDRMQVFPQAGFKNFIWQVPGDMHLADITQLLSPVQAVGAGTINLSTGIQNQAIQLLYQGRVKPAVSIFRMIGIRFLFLHKDVVDWDHITVHKLLKDNPADFKLIYNSLYFELYELISEPRLPHIYVADSPIFISKDIAALASISSSGRLGLYPAIFFNSKIEDNPHNNFSLLPSAVKPKVRFTRVNPVKYSVSIKGASLPFWLVFTDGYHPSWLLYNLNSENNVQMDFRDITLLFRNQLTVPHAQVNGYANAWYIEPRKLDLHENFDLVLYFWPQSFVYIGFIVSGFALVLYLGCIFIPRKHHE